MLLAPPRVALAVLAFTLVSCSDGRSPGDDMESGPDDNDDMQAVEPVAASPDGGRSVDTNTVRDAARPFVRDAAVVDAAAAQVPDASVPADASSEVADAGNGAAAGRDAGGDAKDAGSDAGAAVEPPPFAPAFHIPLRVHRADSGLSDMLLAEILQEVNQIWWRQAGICFEVEVVRTNEVRTDGFDFWFHRSRLGCNANANGVYCGDHDIHSLDAPSLNKADSPAWTVRRGPARTTAHELGHGLNLDHYNGFADSNDSLMSSGRQGFKLHEAEITTARKRAQSKTVQNSPATPCSPAMFIE